MLDQSFSADNFRRILDISNRKGVHVEDKLSITTVRRINERIRNINISIKFFKKIGNSVALKKLYEAKKKLREKKEATLQIELEKISDIVSAKNFSIGLNQVIIPGQKTLYTTKNSPENFFALQQLQRNISRLFGVKQSNRNSIIEQVCTLLNNKFPKYVIRTDIKDFYESIQHEPIIDKLNKDTLLTPFSRKILADVLRSFKTISGLSKGLPRGIGISAYLAELYMRDIDEEISDLQGVTYYARYVDDIIIIFTPSTSGISRNYYTEIKSIIEAKYKLRLNRTKTLLFDLTTSISNHSFNFLGYEVSFGNSEVITDLSTKKVSKYRTRLKSSFDNYVNLSKVDEKLARKMLVKRVRFLTGNTRLTNNKKDILTGIFYSNKHLTEIAQLDALDRYLYGLIQRTIASTSLRKRLRKYKFRQGFEQKRFSSFTTSELKDIMDLWSKKY